MLLDGGPSRGFCDSDIVLMEDDLSALKVWYSLPTTAETKWLLIVVLALEMITYSSCHTSMH